MTDAGRSGGTAQQKADRLRIKADRLARQADAWEAGSEGERAVSRKLDELPNHYVVLHDLQVPGSPTKVDHLVIGPGGIFMVDAKKYSGKLTYGKKMLWHGRFPISGKLEMVQWEAEYISDLIGRSVVPVMCFVDPVLPQPVTTLGSVIVCRSSVLLTVVRSAHTTISETDMHAIVDDLAPLTDGTYTAADVTAETSLWPMSGLDTTGPIALVAATSDGDDSPPAPPRPPRPRRSMVLGIACLVAVLVSAAIVLAISRSTGDPLAHSDDTDPVTTVAATTTTTPVEDTVAEPSTTLVDAENRFRYRCPRSGAGWTLEMVWPGDLPNLAFYDFSYEVEYGDPFQPMGNMISSAVNPPTLTDLDAMTTRIVRVTPAFTTGQSGDATNFVATAPTGQC